YERVAPAAESAGGSVVKYIGDAALITFPEAAVDQGVQALLDLKESIDRLMAMRGWECRLAAKAHFGTAVAGPFGAAGHKQFDILGRAVNTAATLGGTAVTLSADAFRKLGADLRARFNKREQVYAIMGVEGDTTDADPLPQSPGTPEGAGFPSAPRDCLPAR